MWYLKKTWYYFLVIVFLYSGLLSVFTGKIFANPIGFVIDCFAVWFLSCRIHELGQER